MARKHHYSWELWIYPRDRPSAEPREKVYTIIHSPTVMRRAELYQEIEEDCAKHSDDSQQAIAARLFYQYA